MSSQELKECYKTIEELQNQLEKIEAENKKLRSRYDSLKYSCEAYISYFESSQFCKLNCDPSSNFHEPECSFVTNIFKALSSGGE